MLRASSLGSISTLTTRIIFRQCYPAISLRAQASTLQTLSKRPIARAVSTSGAPEGRDDSDSPAHATQKAYSEDQEEGFVLPPPNTFDGETLQNLLSSSSSSQLSLPHILIEGERKTWKNVEENEEPCVRQKLPYATGKSQYPPVVPALYGGKFRKGNTFINVKPSSTPLPTKTPSDTTSSNAELDREVFDVDTALRDASDTQDLYYHLCHIIAKTQSVAEAWRAYSTILTLSSSRIPRQGSKIPFEHLHRLCRLLARNRPRTRTQFLRLLSVLYSIRKYGGQIHTFEWNALISNAGGGWRKTRPEDFKLALDVFEDMVSGMSPGSRIFPSDYPFLEYSGQPAAPDIYTYNSLISIATKTLYGRAVARATSMLQRTGLTPDRITHLSLVSFFTASGQLSGVRATLAKMRQQGLELGLDGVNACIWAHGYNKRVNMVKNIYRVLRHNIHPESPDEEVSSIARTILEEEGIEIPPLMRPNHITYTAVIQTMAWHGNLTIAYNVLIDMLSSEDLELGAPLARDEDGELNHTMYTATYAVFRAVFLGFSRHGVALQVDFVSRLQKSRTWTLSNLRSIYDIYMTLPDPIQPSQAMIYWIMVAFDKTSGHDVELLRQVWKELEVRFHGPWGGPRNRLQKLRKVLFSESAEEHLRQYGFRMAPPVDSRSNNVDPWFE